jgi:purine/pyrimidine-nucleoside phosphorylase
LTSAEKIPDTKTRTVQELGVENFENVTIVKKANIYFDGKVTSRTVLFRDGTKKTLGIILPGEYEFGTADKERMEILAGQLKALLPGAKDWKTCGPGQAFEVPANSKFKVSAAGVVDYCCSYG